MFRSLLNRVAPCVRVDEHSQLLDTAVRAARSKSPAVHNLERAFARNRGCECSGTNAENVIRGSKNIPRFMMIAYADCT